MTILPVIPYVRTIVRHEVPTPGDRRLAGKARSKEFDVVSFSPFDRLCARRIAGPSCSGFKEHRILERWKP